jgi:uncharacterized membrane protein YczE
VRRRLPRLLGAFALLGFAIALTVRADLGLSPWDVLHQGISDRTGVPIGAVGIAVGVLVLFAWIPLGERIALGTVLNVLVIGTCIDLTLLVLPEGAPLPSTSRASWGLHLPHRSRRRPSSTGAGPCGSSAR